jgi:regulatory protein
MPQLPPDRTAPTADQAAHLAALRILATRRVTEAQLWQRLVRKRFAHDEVRGVVEWCKARGYLDDAIFARLYVEGKAKAVGDVRLIGELVRRGVDREAAAQAVASCERDQEARLRTAFAKLLAKRPEVHYESFARSLERLGFPASAIYRHLREHARGDAVGAPAHEDSAAASE